MIRQFGHDNLPRTMVLHDTAKAAVSEFLSHVIFRLVLTTDFPWLLTTSVRQDKSVVQVKTSHAEHATLTKTDIMMLAHHVRLRAYATNRQALAGLLRRLH